MKPDFTQRQKDELCYLIGDWYCKWKNKLINSESETHNLTNACSDLTSFLIDHGYKYDLTDNQLNFILKNINIWHNYTKDTLVSCYKKKHHHFGARKELLKIMICDDLDDFQKEINEYLINDTNF